MVVCNGIRVISNVKVVIVGYVLHLKFHDGFVQGKVHYGF